MSDGPAQLYRNATSWAGALVMAAGGVLEVVSLGLMFTQAGQSPYLGIFTFLVFPAILVAGLLLFLFGMRRESLRRRKAGTTGGRPYPSLDLNDPAQRRGFAWALVGGTLGIILMAFVSYNAFHFTESVPFCGKLCHTVMEPEYSAYMRSPHAKVACVECHVGAGASWYVKSKLSGLRQVWATAMNNYETPIPVPIKDLRPARETCEECHWPQKFWGAQLLQVPHFHYDEQNTAEQMTLLMRTGGGTRGLTPRAGIHWHMIIGNTVTFVATDQQLQNVPWFKVVRDDGTESEYVAREGVPDAATMDALPKHVISCIDCHNRPSHQYPPPEMTVDQAMAAGSIPPTLPFIKRTAVEALTGGDWPDKEAAHAGLKAAILASFKDRPQVLKDQEKEIALAVDSVSEIYDRTVFPAMKVDWSTYASNIGHRNWPGCFRCHDGQHVRKSDGKSLSRECTICHTMPQRGPLVALGVAAPSGDEEWHLWPLKGRHEEMPCVRCHAAGKRPQPSCAGCHKLDVKAPMMSDSCDQCHLDPQHVKPLEDCKVCHDDIGGLHLDGGHPKAACTTCHKPHGWKAEGTRKACETCHKDRKDHYPEDPCSTCHEFKKGT